MFDADDRANAFRYHPGLLFQTEKQVLTLCRTAPILYLLFTLAFWMIAAAVLMVAFAIAVMRGRTGCYPSLLLSLSAGANLWPLADYRPRRPTSLCILVDCSNLHRTANRKA